MSDRAVYVVIEEGVARVAMDRHVGDLAASELEEGSACLERAAAQPSEGRFLAPHNYLGGWLVDRETKRVLHFGGGATSSRMRAAWPGHAVESVQGSEAFEAHVQKRGVPIEPADAIAPAGAPSPLPITPELEVLRTAEQAAPRPAPAGWGTTFFLMSAVGLGLVLRFFTKRWRRRWRARAAHTPTPEALAPLEEAIAPLDEAIAREPTPERLRERAGRLAQGHRLLEAEADLSRALGMEGAKPPLRARLLLDRAAVRAALRLPRLAAADREAALALDPSLRPGLAARLQHLSFQWRALFGEILTADDL